jgi:hypothetical protein
VQALNSRVRRPDQSRAGQSRSGLTRSGLGPWTPTPLALLAVFAGIGLVLCALANMYSRQAVATPELLYYAGVALAVAPIVLRLTSEAVSPRERFALVGLLALTLYLVKVIRDPMLFTLSDEPIHAFNATEVVQGHHLFHDNPVLPITAHYPGLAGATSALATLSGLSVYVTGTILIGAARLTFCLALYLLFARVSDSPRLAGIGVAIYAGSSNFIYWGDQYAYESLALPLLVVVLAALAERERAEPAAVGAWAPLITLGIAAVVVTHHLTSYALVAVLAGLAIASWTSDAARPNPWRFAVLAALAAGAWLLIVASTTAGYLSPVLQSAFEATIDTASGEAGPRALFNATSSGAIVEETPPLARLISLGAVGFLALGFVVGILSVWRRRRNEPMTALFAVGAAGFFAALALRFAPGAWETGNRAAEFFFIGLAFVVATAAMLMVRGRVRIAARQAALAAAVVASLIGGTIAGWPWDAQLADPFRIKSEARTVESEPLELARWAAAHKPEGRFGALAYDARFLIAPGGVLAETSAQNSIEPILEETNLSTWELPYLREHRVRYLVADRRSEADDNVRGYSFARPESESGHLLPVSTVRKFDRENLGRLYDSGKIVVFDVGDHP